MGNRVKKMTMTGNNWLNLERMQWVKLFQKAGINYCILRDIKSCIEGRPPLEIDILIDHNQLSMVREILFRAGYVLRSDRAEYPHFHFYFYNPIYLVSILDIVVDLRAGMSGKLIRTLNSQSVLLNRKVAGGLSILSEDDELVLLLLHSLIDKGTILEKHRVRLEELLQMPEYKISAEHKLSTLIRNKITARKIFEYFTNENIDNFLDMKDIIFWRLFLSASFAEKKNTVIQNFYLFWYSSRWYRRMHQTFKFTNKCKLCSVVGIDGSGKTTFISEFSRIDRNIVPCRLGYGALRRYNLDLTYYMCSIPANIQLEKEKKNKEVKFSNRVWIYANKIIADALDRRPFSPFRPLLPPLLLYFEDIIAIRKSERRAGKKGIVITDRSGIDLVVDILSQGRKIPWIYRFLYMRMYPSPNLIVFLDCGAETAVKRKEEMTLNEAESYNDAYIYFLSHLCEAPSIRVNSTSSIDEMVKTVKLALDGD